MHPDEEGALAEALATGIEKTKLVLIHMVQLQGTGLVPMTGIPSLEAMEFSFSGCSTIAMEASRSLKSMKCYSLEDQAGILSAISPNKLKGQKDIAEMTTLNGILQ